MSSAYFAYGSNLSVPQMRERCPGARPVGPAVLDDHQVAFTRLSPNRGGGVADIVAAPGHTVHGLLYTVTDNDLDALDIHEGGYRRLRLVVRLAGARAMGASSASYLDEIIARAHGRST